MSRSPSSSPASTRPVRLGMGTDSAGGVWGFDGFIDEVRFWDTARTLPEIVDAMYTTLDGTEAGLVAYLPLDEGTGQATVELVTGTACVLGSSPASEPEDPLSVSETPFWF